MADRISYVGLDVHKDAIVVAAAGGGRRGEVREYGRIANTSAALDRLQRKLPVEIVSIGTPRSLIPTRPPASTIAAPHPLGCGLSIRTTAVTPRTRNFSTTMVMR